MTVVVMAVFRNRLTATDDRKAGDGSTPNGQAAPVRTRDEDKYYKQRQTRQTRQTKDKQILFRSHIVATDSTMVPTP